MYSASRHNIFWVATPNLGYFCLILTTQNELLHFSGFFTSLRKSGGVATNPDFDDDFSASTVENIIQVSYLIVTFIKKNYEKSWKNLLFIDFS